MIGKTLAQRLEDDWRETLDGIARARRWPSSGDVARLGASVERLSKSYNDPELRGLVPGNDDALAARLAFSFVRDVPKGAAAVRELVATGTLTMPSDRPLRVLDVGAGLGATTWGIARALERFGARGAIDASWVDSDSRALDVAMDIVRARDRTREPAGATGATGVTIAARAVPRAVGGKLPAGPFDLILLGQVLSELDVGIDPAARVDRHVALVESLLASLGPPPHGALVILEPALRERTRHLHRVRDALLALPAPPTLFAPCLHAARCPALAQEGDWCHDDLEIDLPPWLVPIARAAGLRYQGLTFSYLVLRRDGRTLGGALSADRARLRAVSGAIVTKGKREVFLCGPLEAGPGRARVTLLDRDRTAKNQAFEMIYRGDVVSVDPPLLGDRPRVGKDSTVVCDE